MSIDEIIDIQSILSIWSQGNGASIEHRLWFVIRFISAICREILQLRFTMWIIWQLNCQEVLFREIIILCFCPPQCLSVHTLTILNYSVRGTMAGNQYITNRKNLFDENDDVDDETFLSRFSRLTQWPILCAKFQLLKIYPSLMATPFALLLLHLLVSYIKVVCRPCIPQKTPDQDPPTHFWAPATKITGKRWTTWPPRNSRDRCW